ncbi:pyroglutamyl-peptidase I [Simplicispira lacusdiani]|uniref:pyroglutamyl-peptidase I n=1 Tax=Simplicispira lacusdiani TaxID=2213010 RepID=UPI000E72F173|nr:pyroglutamyl-peptidase I [Simplicispira lacusdiani]
MAPTSLPPGAPLLLTGFNPFGGDTANPSWLSARALHGQRIAGHAVLAELLPTEFEAAREKLQALLARHRPALALCLGQAGGRAALSVERVAINLIDARIPDNRGAQPLDAPVVPGGPAAYFATLPVKAMVRAARQAGLPCEVSQTAGTFVCNAVFYGLMHQLAAGATPGARGGFVHVPWLPEQGSPGMQLRDMVRGVHALLWAAVLHPQDIALGAGALH